MASPLAVRPVAAPSLGAQDSATHRRMLAQEAGLYASAAVLALAAITVMARLWRATWSIPFVYAGDAIGAAAMVKTTLETGWYESQPRLGAPFGQHYHDFPFADDLHLVAIRILGLFIHSWPVVFNLYYILGYPLAAIAGFWFLRRCGLRPMLAVVLSVLFAAAPYHLFRSEAHYFLSGYYMVPFGLGLVLATAKGEPLWGLRTPPAPSEGPPRWRGRARRSWLFSALTGRGAGSVVILVLLAYSGAYYAVFVGLLLGAAGLFAVLARRDWRRCAGSVAAGGVLLGSVLLATVPDVIYEHVHGANPAAYVRSPSDSERYALKFTSLVLPHSRYPIPILARLRTYYDRTFPFPGEQPALGLIAAIGFLLLLGWPLVQVLRGSSASGDHIRRPGAVLPALSVLTWCAFLMSTFGGIGTLVSFFDVGIRGWNRMSIVIMLLSLAGTGLVLQAAIVRRSGRARAASRRRLRALPLAAAILLLVGLFDQSSSGPLFGYVTTDASFRADGAFFHQIEVSEPPGSMIFQTPVISFPEGGRRYRAIDNDQLTGFLHTTTLRWSGGGFRGRPQTDWVRPVAALPPARMTRDLAALGFVGVVVDRYATADDGRELEAGLRQVTGGPLFIGSQGRYAYYSLAAARARLDASMTASQQHALASEIVPPVRR